MSDRARLAAERICRRFYACDLDDLPEVVPVPSGEWTKDDMLKFASWLIGERETLDAA